MTDDGQPGQLPADLAGILLLVSLTALAMLLPGIRETPLRIVFGLAFGLFAPGYALLAALYPEAEDRPASEGADGAGATPVSMTRGLGGIERAVLSVAVSVVVVPAIGIALGFTPLGIRLPPIVLAVGGGTVLCTAVAAYRRRRLPEARRFAVSYRESLAAGQRWLLGGDAADRALNVLVVATVLLALGSVGYAATVPQQGDSFTELYLLTENETGDLVAGGYPSEISVNESESVYLAIENEEHETIEYTVVVQLQRVETDDGDAEVLERSELARFRTTLAHGETHREEHELTPSGELTGENLRLTFLLYDGDPPETPTREAAYRSVHFWVDIEA